MIYRSNFIGRLGNQLMSYIGFRMFSDKFEQAIEKEHSFDDFFTKDETIKDKTILKNWVKVWEGNSVRFFDTYTKDDMKETNIVFAPYILFQNKFWFNLLEQNKSKYVNFKPKTREGVFVHVRLGDIHKTENACPFEYYDRCLSLCNFNSEKSYIASDSLHHPIVAQLIKKYQLNIFDSSPADVIKFGSEFKHKILSSGTFSWWIGFFGERTNTVFCPPFQHTYIRNGAVLPDIFPCFNWIAVDY